ncbi:TPA: hypothetical protein ACWWHZ_002782, partial [Enterococcus faecalis]
KTNRASHDKYKSFFRKEYDLWGIIIIRKDYIEFPFYIECNCGQLAEIVPHKYKEYECSRCGCYFKRVVGGYIEIKKMSSF